MITLHYLGVHGRDILSSLSSSSCDLVILTPGGSARAHRLLLLAHLPALHSLLTSGCGEGQEDTVVVLPGVDTEELTEAIEELYKNFDAVKIDAIFRGGKTKKI